MANDCENTLRVTGPEDEVERFVTKAQGERGVPGRG